jgi:hypothetical protein
MTRFVLILLALVTLLGCQEPFLGDGEDDMRISSQGGGWSASGSLFTMDVDKTVHFQADFPDSGPYTLQFSIIVPPGFVGDASAVAEIDWKVEGNWVHRTISVSNGASISGTAEACKVLLRDADQSGFANQEYQVSVQLAMGTRGNNQQPPILTREGVVPVPALGIVDIDVPQGVGVIATWVNVWNAVGIDPAFLAGSTWVTERVGTGFATAKIYDPLSPRWVPIAPGTVRLGLQNLNGTIAYFQVIFGIDG